MLLTPTIKDYSWGRVGSSSMVAQLLSPVKGSTISEDTPYAELWMGAHPSGSSTLPSGQSLLSYITQHPDVLGYQVSQKFGNSLPFLFKVLSVEKALSIQAHPDKPLAEILYNKDPLNYPDDNHKPEMAIAVTPFEVLCGFRSLDQIQKFIDEIPELRSIIKISRLESSKDLQQAFSELMNCDSKEVALQIVKLLASGDNIPEFELIHRLNKDFPGDVGILCVYFLQHFTLAPGQALYLPANEPHAYLSGDCMECMANSDNVVRAGLTPKFKDVDVLTTMLTFKSGNEWVLQSEELEPGRRLFKPPVEEFAVEVFDKSETFTLEQNGSCSICIVVEGSGIFNNEINLSKGSVLFIPSGTGDVQVVVQKKMKLFRAFCSIDCPSS